MLYWWFKQDRLPQVEKKKDKKYLYGTSLILENVCFYIDWAVLSLAFLLIYIASWSDCIEALLNNLKSSNLTHFSRAFDIITV